MQRFHGDAVSLSCSAISSEARGGHEEDNEEEEEERKSKETSRKERINEDWRKQRQKQKQTEERGETNDTHFSLNLN